MVHRLWNKRKKREIVTRRSPDSERLFNLDVCVMIRKDVIAIMTILREFYLEIQTRLLTDISVWRLKYAQNVNQQVNLWHYRIPFFAHLNSHVVFFASKRLRFMGHILQGFTYLLVLTHTMNKLEKSSSQAENWTILLNTLSSS